MLPLFSVHNFLTALQKNFANLSLQLVTPEIQALCIYISHLSTNPPHMFDSHSLIFAYRYTRKVWSFLPFHILTEHLLDKGV